MQMTEQDDVHITLELQRVMYLGDHGRVRVACRIADGAIQQNAQLAHLVVPVGDTKPGHAHVGR
ncbi:hypothetical protein D3C86_2178960 [compost metagenome]